MAEYRYRLARWNERDKSLRCPQCGRGRGCFKEYLNEDGTPIDPVNHTCGLCDHTSTCGYHLTPKQYYAMNPEQRQNFTSLPIRQKQVKRIEIDLDFAKRTRSCYDHNNFVRWIRSLNWDYEQRNRLEIALQCYNVGTTKDGGTIWWQIDEDMVVRTGKKMLYNAETGKRLKDDEGNSIGFNWIHAMMQKQGAFQDTETERYEMMQCLFGEHLLKKVPNATVCLVESEKTALLMSAYDTESLEKRIWLATGGKYNLQEMKLYPLRNRKVLLYPDRDAVQDWRDRTKNLPYKGIKIYDKWIATMWQPEDGEKADVGDTILRLIQPPTLDQLIEINPAMEILINGLDLEIAE